MATPTIDTAPRTWRDNLAGKTTAQIAEAENKRPAHPLNDQRVRVLDGATVQPVYRNGACVRAGSAIVGVCWGVVDGSALVDFGKTSSGIALRCLVNVDGLEVVSA